MISNSPLIPHIVDFSPDVERWLRSLPVWPRAVLVFSAGVAQAVRRLSPQTVTILRRYVDDQGAYLAQGEAGGARWVAELTDLAGVDYLTGVNETCGDAASCAATNAFYLGFVRACTARGVLPIGPDASVGTPDSALLPLLIPCMHAIMAAGGLVSDHAYGPATLMDGSDWLLRRAIVQWLPWLAPSMSMVRVRFAYTETGWDYVGRPPSGPWRDLVRDGYLTIESMETQLEAYAAQCAQDGVEYAALFTFEGTNGTWRRYDFMSNADLLAWLAQHWENHASLPVRVWLALTRLWARVRAWMGAR